MSWMKILFYKFKKFVVKPEWGFLSFTLACFMFFGLSGNNLWDFFMNFQWIIDATKWSLIGGAFIFGLGAYIRSKQFDDKISKSITQIKTDFTAQENNTKKISELENLLKKTTEEVGKKLNKATVLKFPNVTWLTAKDVMKICDWSINILKQHIENGLLGYVKVSESQKRPLDKERDLIALEERPDLSDSLINQWQFKTEDVKKYMKTT